jgi:outer membrane protein with beta-barrel domain
MKRALLSLICVALLMSLLPSDLKAEGGPERTEHRLVKLFPGGDVLRPGAKSSDGYTWFLGLDAGLTYSMFQNGPINFFTRNDSRNFIDDVIGSTVDDGSGIGFYIGATADFPVNDDVGIVLKANYHSRAGSFENNILIEHVYIGEIFDYRDVTFQDDVDWSFQYIGFDILARIQLEEQAWYLLAGPSIGYLIGNTATVTQSIVAPDNVYYREADQTTTNQITSISGEGEVDGFSSLRIDLKVGVGTWFEISDKLFLTPELTLAYPLTSMVDRSDPDYQSYQEASYIYNRAVSYSDIDPLSAMQIPTEYLDSNSDFNMITIFLTVGLRWQMD